ncbi:MAG: hypothetical protein ACJAYU_000666 [Bradymonadia bacterium]|jgi:hypothetical protein
MNISRKVGIALGVSLLAMGCAELPETSGLSAAESQSERTTAQQPVTVQTRFVLSGHDNVDSELMLDQLFVNVGSLVLDPADGDGIAFTSHDPFELNFDVASGSVDLMGPELQLPYGGDFFVSVQLEPSATEVGSNKAYEDDGSLVAYGHYYVEPGMVADEPSPLPWEPKGVRRSYNVTQHVDFVYQSNSVARIQLGEVSLTDSGDYELLLNVRVGEWLEDDVFPRVLDEQERRDSRGDVPTRLEGTGDVDLDEAVLDEGGEGLEGLVGDMGVGARAF